MKEDIHNYGLNNNLLGIICEPEDVNKSLPIIILLNSGLIHRVGPNRFYVDFARQLTNIGFCSFRFDFAGIGDSIPSIEHVQTVDKYLSEIRETIDYLMFFGGFKKFILMGICSGAEYAFNAGLLNDNVVGIISINGSHVEKEMLISIRPWNVIMLRYYKKNILNIRKVIFFFYKKFKSLFIKRLFNSFIKEFNTIEVEENNNILFGKTTTSMKSTDFSIEPWRQLIKRDVKIIHIFSEGSDSLDVYNATLKKQRNKFNCSKNLEIKILKDIDHTFTPIWSQNLLISNINNWLINYFTKK